ncbi:MAG TPA: 4Fe-4S dicluster domain-containing protein [Firmicutes bacterium]|nr:4Fe-4S dicluster domain-containing protein [Bacillota bacterium]
MDEIKDIVDIKRAVLKTVAQYAYEGTIYQKLEDIPFEIIQGITPKFRCCVYREREIIRQRVRLALGRPPRDVLYTDMDPTQVVHVIPCACEGCPISRFTVTDNCQNCLAQKCIKACPFGAISKTPKGAVIDKTKCKKCGKCYEACPYHAIVDIERPCKKSCPVDAISMDENDIATIDVTKCINCGACVVGCPFGAISDISMMTTVIHDLCGDWNVYAMVAPSIEGQFGPDINLAKIKAGIRALGFKEVYEVALGADMVARNEAGELVENYEQGKRMTSSCCPGFVNLILKHYPTLKEHVSTTVPPMVAAARYIRAIDPKGIIVFIGPCIAKKNDILAKYLQEIPYALTFEELDAMFEAKGIRLAEMETDEAEVATSYGKGFAKSGGVSAAVTRVLAEEGKNYDIRIAQCSGIDECKKALALLKAGKLPEDFIEGMACKGGCIAGPGSVKDSLQVRRGFDKYAKNQNDQILETLEKNHADRFDLHTTHEA